jgi:hypothetical protein
MIAIEKKDTNNKENFCSVVKYGKTTELNLSCVFS